jgi:hypothetical protein
LGEGVGKLKLFVIVHFSCRWHMQSRAYNFLQIILADEDFVIVHQKTTNPNLVKNVTSVCFVIDHFSCG